MYIEVIRKESINVNESTSTSDDVGTRAKGAGNSRLNIDARVAMTSPHQSH